MQTFRYYLFFLLLITLIVPTKAQSNWKTIVTNGIDSLLANHPVMEHASCGILVYDATDDIILYQHDQKKTHRPASTTKTFTCAAVLKYLTSDYSFRTSVYTTGKIKRKRINNKKMRILQGDIFVKGSLDPAFSSADMDTLMMILQANNIDSITGNLYADLSMKDRKLGGSGWCWDDTGDDFPLLHPLLLDKDTTFMSEFYARLNAAGIGVGGYIKDSICPANKRLLAEKCRSLSELLPQCLKTSDNRYAEAFLYQLGTMSGEPFPSTDISMNYVNSMIDSLGCPKEEYHFVDGSGLSFYNYVTPEIEVALLKYIYQLSDFFEEFKNALPISGIDGTLENRMRGTAAEGKVFAKTGTLSGTNTLAGYAYSQNGHMLIFSIMNDGVTTGNSNAARKLQDEILGLLCK